MLCPVRHGLPPYVSSGTDTIGIRIPRHLGIACALQACGPLFSTSANKSGHPVPTELKEVDQDIVARVDAVIEDAITEALPSTILDCSRGAPRVVREGAYAVQELEKLYGSLFVR